MIEVFNFSGDGTGVLHRHIMPYSEPVIQSFI
jgi:hypothetical protein